MIRRCWFLLVFAVGFHAMVFSQTNMRIHHRGGGHSDVPIEQIDSITFVGGSDLPADDASLIGSWLWGDS